MRRILDRGYSMAKAEWSDEEEEKAQEGEQESAPGGSDTSRRTRSASESSKRESDMSAWELYSLIESMRHHVMRAVSMLDQDINKIDMGSFKTTWPGKDRDET